MQQNMEILLVAKQELETKYKKLQAQSGITTSPSPAKESTAASEDQSARIQELEAKLAEKDEELISLMKAKR